MGSKHLRLAVVLMEEAYGGPMLNAEAKKTIEDGFGGVNLDGDQLGAKVMVMKWKTFKGGKEGVLEISLAHEVRAVEAVLVKLLTANGGKEKNGIEPRGPVIRRIDEMITDTWKKAYRQDQELGEDA